MSRIDSYQALVKAVEENGKRIEALERAVAKLTSANNQNSVFGPLPQKIEFSQEDIAKLIRSNLEYCIKNPIKPPSFHERGALKKDE